MSNGPTAALVPTRATFRSDTTVEVEVRGGPTEGEVIVSKLGDVIRRYHHRGSESISLDDLPEGGYGIELRGDGVSERTAIEVSSDPLQRLRYGFVADYSPHRDNSGVQETVRRLHLNAVQFYDWAYRHADLLGGGDQYLDPLGREVSMTSVNTLIGAVQAAGSQAMGYAAVYAVGSGEWDRWAHRALLRAGGDPHALEDFLNLVDPSADDWLDHLVEDLAKAVAVTSFDGFHLDQYGYPKKAIRADGKVVDLAEAFAATIRRIRESLPSSRLIFNNVNDFPTWKTASSKVDAVYVEPWEPHNTLASLATLATRARARGGTKPVVLAAYQSVYGREDPSAANRVLAFTMATIFSHGATQLLMGEDFRVLTDPYYPRNHLAADSTIEMMIRWYDFLVEFDSVLLDAGLVDVTSSYAGTYNNECDVTFESAPVSEEATPGAVWRRITSGDGRLVIHLINLVGQTNTLWDTPRQPLGSTGVGTLRFQMLRGHQPRVRLADPDSADVVRDLEVSTDGEYAVVAIPPQRIWSVLVIDLVPDAAER